MSLGLAYICSSVDLLILEMSTCTHLPFGLANIFTSVDLLIFEEQCLLVLRLVGEVI